MLIFMKEKLVLFSTPKCGSTALEAALGGNVDVRLDRHPDIKHTNVRQFDRWLRIFAEAHMKESPTTVAAFREPVDWLGSWYRYRQRPDLRGKPNSTYGYSFDEFVAAYLSNKRPPWAKLGNQAWFVTNEHNEIGVSHLFRYEDFDRMVAFLSKRLGRTISTIRLNRSPQLTLGLSPELRRELKQKRARDFEIYENLSRH